MIYKQKTLETLEELKQGLLKAVGWIIALSAMIQEEAREDTMVIAPEEDFWIPASEPPKESGEVMVCCVNKEGAIIRIANMDYSAKHRAFNAGDYEDCPQYPLAVDYWKPMPKRVEDLRIRAPKEV